MTDIHRVRELSALLEERERFFDGRLVEVYRNAGVSTPKFSLPRLKSAYVPVQGSASESAVSEKNEGYIGVKGKSKKQSHGERRRIKKKAFTESSCDESEKSCSVLADDEHSVGTGFEGTAVFPIGNNLHRNWRSVVSLSSHSNGKGRRNEQDQDQLNCRNLRIQRDSMHKEVLRTNALEKKLKTRRSSLPLQVAAKTWHRSNHGSVASMEQNKLKQGKQSSLASLSTEDSPFSMTEVLRRTAVIDATMSAGGNLLRDELSTDVIDYDGQKTFHGGHVLNTIAGGATRKKRINKLLNIGPGYTTPSISTIHRRDASPTRSTLSDSFSDGVQSFLQKITSKQNFKEVNASNISIHDNKQLERNSLQVTPPLPVKYPQPSYPVRPGLHHVSPFDYFRQRSTQEEHDYCNDVRFLSLVDALVPCIESTSGRISY